VLPNPIGLAMAAARAAESADALARAERVRQARSARRPPRPGEPRPRLRVRAGLGHTLASLGVRLLGVGGEVR
jgi:hypothetical protein